MLVVLVLILFLPTSFPASASNCSGLKNFIILIDAGSSGSRLHVHAYSQVGDETLPIIEASINKKVKPGLSSYGDKPENYAKAGKSLVELLDFAKQEIPMSCWKGTPVYLQATAGLRSIPPQAAESVLDSCRKTIASYPFLFKPEWALIITGTQEGLNGWIAVNYLKGIFHEAGSPEETVGVIEMGGASMQLTFVPLSPPGSTCDDQHLVTVQIGKLVYRLYTHSYLDYGLEKFQKLFQTSFFDVIEKEGNPCYPVAMRHSSIGSYERCASLIESLLDKTINCSCSPCSFNGIFQPPIQTENFYAIENFYYTALFFGIDQEDDFVLDLVNAGSNFCRTHWSEIVTKYPDHNPSDLEKYCFSAAYIPKILEYGLGFKLSQLPNIDPIREISDTSIDWALGAVLLAILKGDVVDMGVQPFSQSVSVFHHPLEVETVTSTGGWNGFAVAIIIAAFLVVGVWGIRSGSVKVKRRDSNPV